MGILKNFNMGFLDSHKDTKIRPHTYEHPSKNYTDIYTLYTQKQICVYIQTSISETDGYF